MVRRARAWLDPGNIVRGFGVEYILRGFMSHSDGVPPALCRWLLRIAGRLAPPALRNEWRRCWYSRLCSLCILVERGEVAGRDRAELMLLCRDALSNAFWLRFNRAGLRHWTLGPQFVMATAAAGALLLALLSRGFQATRSIIDAAIEWNIEPRQLRYDPRGDLVVGHVVPIVLALAIGSALVAIGRLSLGRYGWRYWLFLAVKIVARDRFGSAAVDRGVAVVVEFTDAGGAARVGCRTSAPRWLFWAASAWRPSGSSTISGGAARCACGACCVRSRWGRGPACSSPSPRSFCAMKGTARCRLRRARLAKATVGYRSTLPGANSRTERLAGQRLPYGGRNVLFSDPYGPPQLYPQRNRRHRCQRRLSRRRRLQDGRHTSGCCLLRR